MPTPTQQGLRLALVALLLAGAAAHAGTLPTSSAARPLPGSLAAGDLIGYSIYLSGGLGQAVAVDAAGNVYVTGSAASRDFPQAHRPVPNGIFDDEVFVAKFDRAGNLLFASLFGGRHFESGLSIDVDVQGRIYVAGYTNSADFLTLGFPPGEVGGDPDYFEYGAGFVAVLDATGTSVLYSRIFEVVDGPAIATDVAVTPDGRAYALVIESFDHFPILYPFAVDGSTPAYPQAYDPGCPDVENVYPASLEADAAGNLYVGGWVYAQGTDQALVEKIDRTGALVYAACLASPGYSYGYGVAAAPGGGAYVTGVAHGAAPGSGELLGPGGQDDVFVTAVGPAGQVLWSRYLGGSLNDGGYGIASDARGGVHLTGYTSSPDFPLAGPLPARCAPSQAHPCQFVARLTPSGDLELSTLLGQNIFFSTEAGEPIAADAQGNTYLVGAFLVKIAAANRPPDCSAAAARPAAIWPSNGRLVPVAVSGVSDPDGDAVEVTVTAVRQDEPRAPGAAPDASGIGTASVLLRAARAGGGDGRVYHLAFTAADGLGATCTGAVTVCVPHDQGRGRTCGDGGALFDSTTSTSQGSQPKQ